MTRKEHIQFCKVCERRKFSKDKGLICGLTHEIADFEGDCHNFLGDRNQIVRYVPEVEKEKKTSSFEKMMTTFILGVKKIKVTSSLVAICVLVFIAMLMSGVHFFLPTAESLMGWGGNYKPLVMNGQYWRLISACFLHAGLIHLLFNMYALIYIGLLLEPVIGKIKFGIAFLLCGLSGSIASFVWHDAVVGVGASGAIFGLYGIYAALLITKTIGKELRTNILISVLSFIAYNLLIGMGEGIDNAAHVGGLLSGFIFGFSLYPAMSKPEQKAKAIDTNAFAILGILLLTIFILQNSAKKIGNYERLMLEFVDVEQKALSLYRLDENTTDAEILKVVQEEGMPNWIRCRELVVEAGKTPELPDEIVERVELLTRYCDYRLECFQLIAKSLKKHTFQYQRKIEEYNRSIELMIQKLQGMDVDEKDLFVSESKPKVQPQSVKGEPLYVVDGIPVKSIDDISADRIESVKVLKDAAATALYGSRAQHGAIIVETKKGSQ